MQALSSLFPKSSPSNIFESISYKTFRSNVSLRSVVVAADENWQFYEVGDKSLDPVVFLHGTSSTADVYFLQLLALKSKGTLLSGFLDCSIVSFCRIPRDLCADASLLVSRGLVQRILSIPRSPENQTGALNSHFVVFLLTLSFSSLCAFVLQFHLITSSLGGFLALLFVNAYPGRVQSLVLCNAFCDSTPFYDQAPMLSAFVLCIPPSFSFHACSVSVAARCDVFFSSIPYFPEFYLKKYLLENFPTGEMEAKQADAIDFVVTQLDSLSQPELASSTNHAFSALPIRSFFLSP